LRSTQKQPRSDEKGGGGNPVQPRQGAKKKDQNKTEAVLGGAGTTKKRGGGETKDERHEFGEWSVQKMGVRAQKRKKTRLTEEHQKA